MCEFISWIEKDGVNLYLTAADLKSSRGKRLRKRIGNDINGHGAIREFYDIAPGVGVEKECTDFSTPENFPADIVADIKAGKFRGVGVAEGLLAPEAQAQCEAVRDPALAQYKAVCDQAQAQYEAVCDPAWAQYEAVCDPAWAQYEAVRDPAWAQYEAVRDPALAQYEAVCDPAWAQYKAVRDQAQAQYKAVCDPALAQYEAVCDHALAQYEAVCDHAQAQYDKIKQRTFWNLFAKEDNRAEAWREVEVPRDE